MCRVDGPEAADGVDSVRPARNVDILRATQMLTTEHFALQTARASTIAETNGRTSLFVSTTAAAVVALALIAQVSQLGQTFLTFALLLLPALCFLGVVTPISALFNRCSRTRRTRVGSTVSITTMLNSRRVSNQSCCRRLARTHEMCCRICESCSHMVNC
jgi:hypothetical protein